MKEINTVEDLISELRKYDKDTPIRIVKNKEYARPNLNVSMMYDPEYEFVNILILY